jgi:hypothetical protein
MAAFTGEKEIPTSKQQAANTSRKGQDENKGAGPGVRSLTGLDDGGLGLNVIIELFLVEMLMLRVRNQRRLGAVHDCMSQSGEFYVVAFLGLSMCGF